MFSGLPWRIFTIENWSQRRLEDYLSISSYSNKLTSPMNRNRNNALGLRRLFTHLRLDIKITIVQTTTFLLWYIDIILTSFDLENVIVSIIDIYVDFNKMACSHWRWQIFLCLAEVWLFQRYNSRKQQLNMFLPDKDPNLGIIFKLTNVINFVLFYKYNNVITL